MIHILTQLGQKVVVEDLTHNEGMLMWRKISGGIHLDLASRFLYQFDIAPKDFVDLEQDDALDMLEVGLTVFAQLGFLRNILL